MKPRLLLLGLAVALVTAVAATTVTVFPATYPFLVLEAFASGIAATVIVSLAAHYDGRGSGR